MMCCNGSGKSRLVSWSYINERNKLLTFKVDSWQQKMEIRQHKIEMELQKGVWCGYQNSWNTTNAKITYEKLLLSSTNMKNPGIGLDKESGIIAS